MDSRPIGAFVACVAWLVGGCAATSAYTDAKVYQSSGGAQRDISAAEKRQADERSRQAALQRDARDRQAAIDDLNRRIASANADLAEQGRRLEAARRERRIGDAQYTDLKRRQDGLRKDLSTIDRPPKPGGGGASDADKERVLADLDRRRAELEKALAIAVQR
jgi:chromosome segregation ATPase